MRHAESFHGPGDATLLARSRSLSSPIGVHTFMCGARCGLTIRAAPRRLVPETFAVDRAGIKGEEPWEEPRLTMRR